jgi:hypothetical protein
MSGAIKVAGVESGREFVEASARGFHPRLFDPQIDARWKHRVKTSATIRNRWLIPIYTESVEAVWVKLGEPDPALFVLPASSKQ